jgi:hypothetical protein
MVSGGTSGTVTSPHPAPSRGRIITAKYLTALFIRRRLSCFSILCTLLGIALFGSGDLIVHHYGKFGIVLIPEAQIPSGCSLPLRRRLVHDRRRLPGVPFFGLGGKLCRPIIGSMAVVIVFLVLEICPGLFRDLSPYLFTAYMNLWQRSFDIPIPWGQHRKISHYSWPSQYRVIFDRSDHLQEKGY